MTLPVGHRRSIGRPLRLAWLLLSSSRDSPQPESTAAHRAVPEDRSAAQAVAADEGLAQPGVGGATVISHGRHLPIGHAGDDEGYLHAIIDCCTPELGGWSLELRCRDDEAIACVEAAVLARHPARPAHAWHRQWQPVHLPRLSLAPVGPRDRPSVGWLPGCGVAGVHRVLVRAVQEAPGMAIRVEVTRPGEKGDRYLHRGYHRRPHSGLAYRTPTEVAAAWRPDPDILQTPTT